MSLSEFCSRIFDEQLAEYVGRDAVNAFGLMPSGSLGRNEKTLDLVRHEIESR